MITDGQIKQLAVSCGFKLTNETGDDLKPYVYEFARELIALAQQVKPLEFVLEEEVWKAHTELGCICIFGVHDCRWVLYFDDDECNNQRFATKAAAIEAANADYRKWVLSCLVWGWV